MPTRILSVHPVLMTSNIANSVRFYEGLGFALVFQDQESNPNYVGVRRDAVELHLQWHDRSQWAHAVDRPTYRFVVQDVDDLYQEFQERNALKEAPNQGSPYIVPTNSPWGTREFHVLDPDGNGLQFYRSLKSC